MTSITDPPYADAVRYEEITEYLIAWLRKGPPNLLRWVWDSRRPLAIKAVVKSSDARWWLRYCEMAHHMPDNGLQIVMFTHQDPSVWAEMASIVWGAGLQVTAAWYIATETNRSSRRAAMSKGLSFWFFANGLRTESVYRDELAEEIRVEVAQQIDTMVGLNQETKGRGPQ